MHANDGITVVTRLVDLSQGLVSTIVLNFFGIREFTYCFENYIILWSGILFVTDQILF